VLITTRHATVRVNRGRPPCKRVRQSDAFVERRNEFDIFGRDDRSKVKSLIRKGDRGQSPLTRARLSDASFVGAAARVDATAESRADSTRGDQIV
jgi:hypothetical protein